MPIATVNPATGETLRTFEPATDEEIDAALTRAVNAFREHRLLPFAERAALMTRAAEILETEKNELKAKVDVMEKEYERLNVKDDQFDISESLGSVGIALLGITALTQKRRLLYVALLLAGFGLLIGLSGFLGWNIRPEWLAKVIGA